MKTISFEKLNFESTDILSRLQMKKVKGGHNDYCECSCTNGVTWQYTPVGQNNTPAQPSHDYLMSDAAEQCQGAQNVGGCTGCTNW
jgi:natural product precursor